MSSLYQETLSLHRHLHPDQIISNVSRTIKHINDSQFQFCVAKSVATLIGGCGAVTLMAAPFCKVGTEMLFFVAVGSLGTLSGVGIHLVVDLIHTRSKAELVAELKKVEETKKKSSSKLQLELLYDPSLVLKMVGISGPTHDMKCLSHTSKLLQVHALLVRMFLINMKLVIKMGSLYGKKEDVLFYKVMRAATHSYSTEGLKWIAVVSTGLILLIDGALLLAEWKGESTAWEAGEGIVAQIKDNNGENIEDLLMAANEDNGDDDQEDGDGDKTMTQENS